ncbi:MAG: hypothetical protein A2928_00080 [Candidatus Taylorbacteria bacterium RIFCSPLOWO2_01_FULL_45_15b]|uniref:Glycosyl transferase family 9 n=1 Tax=Candidatus Taylorbacteria bacterium RIFCSPLOWO2_01_FULL_45_15b TaxID=1802319 RepID=A0A1G2NAU0_9BACT|nr:MAG: hypothetical protein A2928_00080 [Candidatus Taylorbacteria bacterium RIFCSPLOWO2_01_FULL_45_15b]
MVDSRDMLPIERLKFAFYLVIACIYFPFMAVKKRRRNYILPHNPRILVIPILTRIGDMVCATPVFRSIKERFPAGHLSVACGKKILDVIRNNPSIDEIINVNDLPFKGFWGRGRFFLFIGKKKYDVVISLSNNPFNNLVAAFAVAAISIKTIHHPRTRGEKASDWFNRVRIEYKDGTRIADHYKKLLAPLGIHNFENIKEVQRTSAGDIRAKRFIASVSGQREGFLVGISISAGNSVKEWGDEKFLELVRELNQVQDIKRFLVIGSARDKNRVEEFVRKAGESCVPVADFRLEDLPSLVSDLDLFIAADTGLIHIADALNVPLIDIVGPVDPHEQAPIGPKRIVVVPEHNVAPSVFAMKLQGSYAEQKKAINSTMVRQVLSAARTLLDENI